MPMESGSSPRTAAPSHPISRLLDRLAVLLPAQGPITIFIHHNPLHAFEHHTFEQAVVHAAERLGCEPFLSEGTYRAKLASGRILAADVEAVLRDELGARAADDVAGLGSRLDLWRAIVLHGIPAVAGDELSWALTETPALAHFRPDLPPSARSALAAPSDGAERGGEE